MKNMESIPNILVEIAHPEDAVGIALVQHKTWLKTYPNEEFGVTEEDILAKDMSGEANSNRWKEAIQKPNRRTWVVKDQNVIVGFCFVKNGDEVNTLGALYVLPEYQGKGIGGALIREALDYLGTNKTIILEVAAYNKNAIEFYKKFGFKESEELHSPHGALPSGIQIPEIRMVRDVANR